MIFAQWCTFTVYHNFLCHCYISLTAYTKFNWNKEKFYDKLIDILILICSNHNLSSASTKDINQNSKERKEKRIENCWWKLFTLHFQNKRKKTVAQAFCNKFRLLLLLLLLFIVIFSCVKYVVRIQSDEKKIIANRNLQELLKHCGECVSVYVYAVWIGIPFYLFAQKYHPILV